MLAHEEDGKFSYMFFETLSYTLSDRMIRGYLCKRNKYLAIDEIFKIGRDILLGLKELHFLGYSHRDLKPDNIMYSESEKVWKLIDLGVVSDGQTA